MNCQTDSYLHIITKYTIPFPHSLADPYPDNSPKLRSKEGKEMEQYIQQLSRHKKHLVYFINTFFLRLKLRIIDKLL